MRRKGFRGTAHLRAGLTFTFALAAAGLWPGGERAQAQTGDLQAAEQDIRARILAIGQQPAGRAPDGDAAKHQLDADGTVTGSLPPNGGLEPPEAMLATGSTPAPPRGGVEYDAIIPFEIRRAERHARRTASLRPVASAGPVASAARSSGGRTHAHIARKTRVARRDARHPAPAAPTLKRAGSSKRPFRKLLKIVTYPLARLIARPRR